MPRKKSDPKNPDGVTKLKILNLLTKEDLDTKELRRKLKKDPDVGKGEGSFSKDTFDGHIKEYKKNLKDMGLIKIEKNPKGKGHSDICKLNDIGYNELKNLYKMYKGDKRKFLSTFAQDYIDENFLKDFSKYIQITNPPIFSSIFREYIRCLPKKYNNMDFWEEKLRNLVEKSKIDKDEIFFYTTFPKITQDTIISILKRSPSTFDLIIDFENYYRKFLSVFEMNIKHMILSHSEDLQPLKKYIDNVNFLDFLEDYLKTAKNTELEVSDSMPILKLFRSYYIVDYYEDRTTKYELPSEKFMKKIFV